jgi:multimeric flavodoxin WrbA
LVYGFAKIKDHKESWCNPLMKIAFINSSNRLNGNTERLLKALMSQLIKTAEGQHIAIEIRHITLSRQEIKTCRGCRCCFDRGDCPLEDDVAKIEELITDCDALVLASPVYMEDVNGVMKTWIDRMAFCAHRPIFFDKCAIAISTSGAGSSSHTLNTMKNALNAWGCHILSAHKFRMGAYMENEFIEERYASKLSDIAASLICSIQNNAAQKPALLSLISFKIQQKYYRTSNRAGTLDRTYWKEKGWLDPHAYFYMPVRCNPIKLLTANIVGMLLAKLFI